MNLLGHCKDCDFVLFSAESEYPYVTGFSGIQYSGTVYKVGNYGLYARCDQQGHRAFRMEPIKGTYSPEHKCDSRCLNAKSRKCSCSCGGANHGKGHVAVHKDVVELHGQVKLERHLGEIGKHIVGEVKLERKHRLQSGTVIHDFRTLDKTARITWFAPEYAADELNLSEGSTMKIRAKVKAHEENPRYGKSTIVTYVEVIDE